MNKLKFISIIKNEKRIKISSRDSTTMLACQFNSCGCNTHWQKYGGHFILSAVFSVRSAVRSMPGNIPLPAASPQDQYLPDQPLLSSFSSAHNFLPILS
jgi:hypothetical protein